MRFAEMMTLLRGTLLTDPLSEIEALITCGAADLMEEIKQKYPEGSVLVTGLTTGGGMQTALDYNLAAVIMVRGKKPSLKELELAQANDLSVLMTRVYHLWFAVLQGAAGLRRFLVSRVYSFKQAQGN